MLRLGGAVVSGESERGEDMATWVSSDWHCPPQGLKPNVVQWIGLGKGGNHRLVGAGDLFDILPYGRKEWEPPKQPAALTQFVDALDGYGFEYVAGNHDPFRIMEALTAPYENVKVFKRLKVEGEGERTYFCTHGHRWAIDWGFLGLRRVAPAIVEFMVDRFPGVWNWICRQMGWLASELNTESPSGEEKEKITRLTRVIWAGAADCALRDDCCVVLGHTHTTSRRERGCGRDEPAKAYMVDGGNLGDDGSYVEITQDARVVWLPQRT